MQTVCELFGLTNNGVFKTKELSKKVDTLYRYSDITNHQVNLYETQNKQILFRLDSAVYKYNINNDKFELFFILPPEAYYYSYLSIFSDNNNFYISNSKTLWLTTDTGKSFVSVLEDTTLCTSIYGIQLNNDMLYLLKGRALYKADKSGHKWNNVNFELYDGSIFSILPVSRDTLFVLTTNGFYESYDRGKSYLKSFQSCTVKTNFGKLMKVNNSIFGCIHDFFIYSDNNGEAWKQFNPNLEIGYDFDVDSSYSIYWSNHKTSDLFKTITDIYCDLPKDYNNNKYYLPTICGKANGEIVCFLNERSEMNIYKSYDNGVHWTKTMHNFKDLFRFKKLGDIIIGVPSYGSSDSSDRGLYISKDFGDTWDIISMNDNKHYFDYFFTPEKGIIAVRSLYENNAFTGKTDLLINNDLGKIWRDYSIGLDSIPIKYIEFGHDSTIWVGTRDGGVYYKSYEFTSVQKDFNPQNEISYLAISPNPVKDFLEITFGANGCSPLQDIVVYNVFGVKVLSTSPQPSTFLEREFPPRLTSSATPQEGNFRINVSTLPPGVYFVRVGEKVGKFIKI